MSEGQVVTSKKYWMICINQDMAVLAYCNMTTGGEINCWPASASQHTILYNSGKMPKFVGRKIRSMRNRLFFFYIYIIIRGIHSCVITSGKTCSWTISRDFE